MQVHVASILHHYTGGSGSSTHTIESSGSTVGELMADLEARYPGIRFRVVDEQDRVRPHVNVFVGGELARTLEHPIAAHQEVHILQALSGG